MNINTNVYKQYVNSKKTYSNYSQPVFSLDGVKKTSAKQDTFSFSAQAALMKETSKTAKSYAADIAGPASDERIESLKAQIKNGEYNVSSEKVADSILNRWI